MLDLDTLQYPALHDLINITENQIMFLHVKYWKMKIKTIYFPNNTFLQTLFYVIDAIKNSFLM